MKCPNCGKKFAYEEVNNVVEHNDKEMPVVCPYCRTEAARIVTHGYFITEKIKETFPNEWYLDSISVSEDFRGQGIGSRLLEALPKLAKKANRSVIGLSVDEKNPKAKKLYERHDFKVVGQRMISGHLYDHMQKNI